MRNTNTDIRKREEIAFAMGREQGYREVLALIRRMTIGTFLRSAEVQDELIKAIGIEQEAEVDETWTV